MIGFVIGFFIGAVFGVAIMALCVASSKEPPAMINNTPGEATTCEKIDL
jgi:hypothetical protein